MADGNWPIRLSPSGHQLSALRPIPPSDPMPATTTAPQIPARPVFTDAHDPPRQWFIRVTLGHVRNLQAMYPDFRLERLLVADSEEYRRLSEDSVLLCHVLETLLSDQLRDRGLTLEDLLQDFTGQTSDAAYMALVSAVANFCHSRVAKEQARRILAAHQALIKLDQHIGEQLETSFGTASGGVPPVPTSAPGTTPSANSASSPTLPPGGEPPPSVSISEPFPLPPHPATSTP